MTRDLKHGLLFGGGFMLFMNFIGRLTEGSSWEIVPAATALAFMVAVLIWPVKR